MPANIAPLSNGALLVVVVGSTFHDQLTPIVVPKTPTRQPPNIRRDPAETRSTLFKLRKRLPFRLEVPTVLERNSYLDDGPGETPSRVYVLGGQPTLRLTYRLGGNEYWGIQMTRWADAPALADKSLTQRIGGRLVRPLLHGPAPAHGRPARQRRDVLGREHAAGFALERDDARDRPGLAPDGAVVCCA